MCSFGRSLEIVLLNNELSQSNVLLFPTTKSDIFCLSLHSIFEDFHICACMTFFTDVFLGEMSQIRFIVIFVFNFLCYIFFPFIYIFISNDELLLLKMQYYSHPHLFLIHIYLFIFWFFPYLVLFYIIFLVYKYGFVPGVEPNIFILAIL